MLSLFYPFRRFRLMIANIYILLLEYLNVNCLELLCVIDLKITMAMVNPSKQIFN